MARPVYDLMSPGGWSRWPAPALPVVRWQPPLRRGLLPILFRFLGPFRRGRLVAGDVRGGTPAQPKEI